MAHSYLLSGCQLCNWFMWIYNLGCTSTFSRFRCSNGQCISSSSRCNGVRTCSDGSDEMNCCRLYQSIRTWITQNVSCILCHRCTCNEINITIVHSYLKKYRIVTSAFWALWHSGGLWLFLPTSAHWWCWFSVLIILNSLMTTSDHRVTS